ncbi:hypothetical protein [Gordonia sp. UCD-TK1]|uniref:hypothetical protein n=1 Tax=Gordonia sp. UCD-TK1 TaxID=1857893 RepID=UPI00080E861E|nr:hypothetical protein [Gordonia sp. UCD-TK1]OCH80184.1 hypothetical protein A9310_22440 [Gordonia sp. UCD-TK1]
MSVPSLATVIAKHRYREQDHCTIAGIAYCWCGWSTKIVSTHKTAITLHGEHVAAVIRDSRVVRSDNLDDSWPTGTVIQEIHDCGELCENCFYPPLWEMAFQCGWSRVGKMYDPGDDQPAWPCRVLYLPADEAEVQQ